MQYYKHSNPSSYSVKLCARPCARHLYMSTINIPRNRPSQNAPRHPGLIIHPIQSANSPSSSQNTSHYPTLPNCIPSTAIPPPSQLTPRLSFGPKRAAAAATHGLRHTCHPIAAAHVPTPTTLLHSQSRHASTLFSSLRPCRKPPRMIKLFEMSPVQLNQRLCAWLARD